LETDTDYQIRWL